MKISWRDRGAAALISMGGMRDSFQIVGGMRDLNDKWPYENLTRCDLDKDSESEGMAGWNDVNRGNTNELKMSITFFSF